MSRNKPFGGSRRSRKARIKNLALNNKLNTETEANNIDVSKEKPIEIVPKQKPRKYCLTCWCVIRRETIERESIEDAICELLNIENCDSSIQWMSLSNADYCDNCILFYNKVSEEINERKAINERIKALRKKWEYKFRRNFEKSGPLLDLEEDKSLGLGEFCQEETEKKENNSDLRNLIYKKLSGSANPEFPESINYQIDDNAADFDTVENSLTPIQISTSNTKPNKRVGPAISNGRNRSTVKTHRSKDPLANQILNAYHKSLEKLRNDSAQENPNSRMDDVKKLNCPMDKCKYKFRNKEKMSIHIRRIHEGKKKCFVCSSCNKDFKDKGSLENHERTHTNSRPFICEYCGKDFGNDQSLKHHLCTHTGIASFSCSICKKGFLSNRDKNEHELSHHKEKTVKSTHCHKMFKTTIQMNRHVKILHSSTKPIACSACGLMFDNKCELQEHSSHHCTFKSPSKMNQSKPELDSKDETDIDMTEESDNHNILDENEGFGNASLILIDNIELINVEVKDEVEDDQVSINDDAIMLE